jgi:predicted ribosomally synthesized peptide with SipW-like signal peptide
MKKILLSILTIALVATVAVGVTRAYFTDQATVSNNTFTAGKLNFTLNGDMTETKSITIAGLEPGAAWSGPYIMDIYNQDSPVSTMDMKYKFAPAFVSQTVGGFYSKLNTKVVHGYCDGSYLGGVNPTNTYQGALSAMSWDSIASSIGGGKLSPNITHCFALYFQLDSTAGNVYQGASAVVNMVVNGTQFINPGWTE